MAQNDFLAFATGGNANVTDQGSWAQDPTVSNGFFGGIAPSAKVNKALRQGTFVAASVSEWVNQQLLTVPIPDDGVVQEWVNNFNAALLQLISGMTRWRLTAPLNLYVNATGDDSNNGLTPLTPFETPQRAWLFIMEQLDIGGQTVTVNMANGIYPGFNCDGTPVGAESQEVIFQGNMAEPGLVEIVSNTGNAVEVYGGARVLLQGFTVQATGTGVYGMGGGSAYINNLVFNSCGYGHMISDQHSLIELVGPYVIAGGAPSHIFAVKGGHMGSGLVQGFTVTLIGTPNFPNGFCVAAVNGTHDHNYGMVFSGTSQGPRFNVSANASIIAHANINYFPGSVAGTIDSSTFGIYM